jgi:hypothetical protein
MRFVPHVQFHRLPVDVLEALVGGIRKVLFQRKGLDR